MADSIKDLNKLWEKDRDYYRKVEVGTGVQSFVKKLLESEEIFNLGSYVNRVRNAPPYRT